MNRKDNNDTDRLPGELQNDRKSCKSPNRLVEPNPNAEEDRNP